MLAFAVVFLLGLVIALLLGGRRHPDRILVVQPYIDRQARPETRPRTGLLWALLFALALGAALALWPRWTAAHHPLGDLTYATAGTAERSAALVGVAEPVGATPSATALVIAASATALNAEGLALLRQGRYLEAEALFRRAIAAEPAAYEPYNNLAFCLYERGEIDAAIDAWRQALEREPASADARAGLGMALFLRGRAEEGRSYYQQAVALNAGYADEAWMRAERLWSVRALDDSRPLR